MSFLRKKAYATGIEDASEDRGPSAAVRARNTAVKLGRAGAITGKSAVRFARAFARLWLWVFKGFQTREHLIHQLTSPWRVLRFLHFQVATTIGWTFMLGIGVIYAAQYQQEQDIRHMHSLSVREAALMEQEARDSDLRLFDRYKHLVTDWIKHEKGR